MVTCRLVQIMQTQESIAEIYIVEIIEIWINNDSPADDAAEILELFQKDTNNVCTVCNIFTKLKNAGIGWGETVT